MLGARFASPFSVAAMFTALRLSGTIFPFKPASILFFSVAHRTTNILASTAKLYTGMLIKRIKKIAYSQMEKGKLVSDAVVRFLPSYLTAS